MSFKSSRFQKVLIGQNHQLNSFETFGVNEVEKQSGVEEEEEGARFKQKRQYKGKNGLEYRPDETPYGPGITEKEFNYEVGQNLLIAADRDLDGLINFSEQLLIRRALIAWLQCSATRMNRTDLKCGLVIVTPFRSPHQSEVDLIFDVGIKITPTAGKNISFITFVMLCDI